MNSSQKATKKKKKMPIGGFGGLMVVGGQHDDGGCSSNSSLSFSYKCFVNIRSFILVIVKSFYVYIDYIITLRNQKTHSNINIPLNIYIY